MSWILLASYSIEFYNNSTITQWNKNKIVVKNKKSPMVDGGQGFTPITVERTPPNGGWGHCCSGCIKPDDLAASNYPCICLYLIRFIIQCFVLLRLFVAKQTPLLCMWGNPWNLKHLYSPSYCSGLAQNKRCVLLIRFGEMFDFSLFLLIIKNPNWVLINNHNDFSLKKQTFAMHYSFIYYLFTQFLNCIFINCITKLL